MIDPWFKVPATITIQHRVLSVQQDVKPTLNSWIDILVPGKFSSTVDAWSSRIHRGYLEIKAHQIDTNREFKSKFLDFFIFPRLHMKRIILNICTIAFKYGVYKNIIEFTTGSGSDICCAMRLLHDVINGNHSCIEVPPDYNYILYLKSKTW